MVSKNYLKILVIVIISISLVPWAIAQKPKGAKAIFDSGEGPSVGMSVAPTQRTPSTESIRTEKYMGISYQIMLLSDDGQFRVVPKSRIFKSGERIKLLVRTNRPGYLNIMNVGPTGNTNILFNDYIEAFNILEIPRNTNLRFVGDPGTEKLLVMLSNNQIPVGVPGPQVTAVGPQPQPLPEPLPPPSPSSQPLPLPPPPSASPSLPPPSDISTLPPPPPALVASIEGAKRIKGAKDIVVDDGMKTSYAVISPKNNWKPAKSGMKDIVLENQGGVNYGAIPISAVSDGGILTLEIKLTHQ